MRNKIKSKCLAYQLSCSVKIINLFSLKVTLCHQVFFPYDMMPLMKNQWNWYKPVSVEKYLCLLDSSAELFETITKIKGAQIILQHEYHSFERKHTETDWRIYLLSSLLLSLLFLLGLLFEHLIWGFNDGVAS